MARLALLAVAYLVLPSAAVDPEHVPAKKAPKAMSPKAVMAAKHKADLAMCGGRDVCKMVSCAGGYSRTAFCPSHGKLAGTKECRCHSDITKSASAQLELAVPSAEKGAAKLDSHKCRQAIDKEAKADWAKLSRPRNTADFYESQQTYTTTAGATKVTYVRNQKAGSSSMVQEFARALGAANAPGGGGATWSRLNGYKPAPFAWSAKSPFPAESKDKKVLFTVVRDPVETVVDGYLDIVKKMSETHGKDINHLEGKHEWLHMDCKDPHARFSAFLDAVEAREPLGHQANLAFPQAVKTNVVTPRYKGKRFDAVLKLEDLHSGMLALGQMSGVQNVTMPPPKQHLGHTNEHKSCANLDLAAHPDIMQRVCKMYAVDFACLDYELPKACEGMKL